MGTTYIEATPHIPDITPITNWVYTNRNANQLGDATEEGVNKIGSLLRLSYWESAAKASIVEYYFLPMRDMDAATTAWAVRDFAAKVAPDLTLPLVEEKATVENVCSMLLGDLRAHMESQHRAAQPQGV